MKKIILPILIVLYCIGLSIVSLTSVPIASAEPVNCWQQHMAADGCTPQYSACTRECPKDASTAQRACEDACSKESRACRDKSLANYRACVNAQQNGQQTSETKKLQPFPEQLEGFLEDVKQGQIAIDQCPPPRIPSESDCVAAKLPSLDIPLYLKDVNFKYADNVILDAPSGVQMVSFSKDTIVPKSVDAKKYGDPSNFILTPEIHIAKKTARPQFILSAEEAGTSSVSRYENTLSEGFGDYSVYNMPGKTWESGGNLVVLDKDSIRDIVTVGGPAGNSVTQMVLASDAKVTLADFPKKSLMEVSNGARIVVAGTAADDTLEAAKDFISVLK